MGKAPILDIPYRDDKGNVYNWKTGAWVSEQAQLGRLEEISLSVAGKDSLPKWKPTRRVLIAMPTMGKLSIVQRSLPSLIENTNRDLCDLYVIVQGQFNDVLDYLQAELPGVQNVHVIANKENVGYGQGIAQAFAFRESGQHTIHMDEDVVLLRSDIVEKLSRIVESGKNIGFVNPDGGNTGKTGAFEEIPNIGTFRDTGYVYTTFALMASWVADKFGATWQPGLYGWEDYITSKRVQRLGYRVGYWVTHPLVYDNIGMSQTEEERAFKLRQRKQTLRSERKRANMPSARGLTDIWESDGPGGPLFMPLPDRKGVPVLF